MYVYLRQYNDVESKHVEKTMSVYRDVKNQNI